MLLLMDLSLSICRRFQKKEKRSTWMHPISERKDTHRTIYAMMPRWDTWVWELQRLFVCAKGKKSNSTTRSESLRKNWSHKPKPLIPIWQVVTLVWSPMKTHTHTCSFFSSESKRDWRCSQRRRTGEEWWQSFKTKLLSILPSFTVYMLLYFSWPFYL